MVEKNIKIEASPEVIQELATLDIWQVHCCPQCEPEIRNRTLAEAIAWVKSEKVEDILTISRILPPTPCEMCNPLCNPPSDDILSPYFVTEATDWKNGKFLCESCLAKVAH